jgi:acetyltransferase
VSSHTGTLAGSKAASTAAFRKAGVIAADTVEELFDFAEGFSRQPLPAGQGVAIITNAGGPAILATDACERYGVRLARLSSGTTEALRSVMPPAAALYNPVDVLGDADAARYERAARIVAADPAVNSLIVVLTPQAMTQPEATALAIGQVAAESGITTLAVFMGDRSVAAAVEVLRENRIPSYVFPERAAATLGAMERHRTQLQRPESVLPVYEVDRASVHYAIDHARQAGRTFITESSAQSVASAYGIRVPAAGLAADRAAARELAARIGYPVVMKIASPDILHKSDIGGIALGLGTQEDLDAAYEGIMHNVRHRMPDATVWGVTIQEEVPTGREVIIGVDRDPEFGPVLMFGLGGVFVEVLKDVTFRLCPVTPAEALEMVGEIRGAGILRGARGAPPADIDSIVDVICRVSSLAMEFDDVSELDINPLIVGDRGRGCIAADIRIGIGG